MKKNEFIFIIVLIVALSFIISFFSFFKNNEPGSKISNYPVILVGTNAEYQPFCFIKDHEIVGFDIDVITEIAHRLGKQIVIKDLSFDTLLPELQLGNLHVVAAGLTPTEERAKRVLFTTPHLETGGFVICVKKESPIRSTDDLKGHIIAVNEGYAAEQYISQFKDISLLRLASSFVSEGLLALDANRADAFIAARAALVPLLKDPAQQEKYTVFPIEQTTENCAFAVSKHHATLIPLLEKVIFEMKQDGTIAQYAKKWEIL